MGRLWYYFVGARSLRITSSKYGLIKPRMGFLWQGDCPGASCESWCHLPLEDPKMQSRGGYLPSHGREDSPPSALNFHIQRGWNQAIGWSKRNAVWIETGDKNNDRKIDRHKTGTEPTFLKIWSVRNGTRHTKHMVWLLPAWVMRVDRVVFKSAGTAGSVHTDDSISEIIWNGSHASEGAQSPYLPFKVKKPLHRQENIKGMLEGFTAMHINERLLLANYPIQKHIPRGSTKDPWKALVMVGGEENKLTYEVQQSFCCLELAVLGCAFARDVGYKKTLGRQIFSRGTAARPREESSPLYAHCLTSVYNYILAFHTALNTSWQN